MLVLVSGPSGAGKSTLVKSLLDQDGRLVFSISTTTRPQRNGETEGVQYHFVDSVEFDRLVAAGAFVEWAHVHDHRYGTQNDDLTAILNRGAIPLLDLDVQGGQEVMNRYGPEVVSIFIFPPSWEVLEQRLRKRETDPATVIETRLKNARHEVSFASNYEYFVVNDDLKETIERIGSILTAEQCRRVRWEKMPLMDD